MALAHVTLATRSVGETRDFLSEVFGFRPIDRPNNIPMSAAWLDVGSGQELHLLEVADFVVSDFEREYGRHLALKFAPSAYEAILVRLQARGIDVIAPLRDTPHRRFFFEDPNGYVFEVIEDL